MKTWWLFAVFPGAFHHHLCSTLVLEMLITRGRLFAMLVGHRRGRGLRTCDELMPAFRTHKPFQHSRDAAAAADQFSPEFCGRSRGKVAKLIKERRCGGSPDVHGDG